MAGIDLERRIVEQYKDPSLTEEARPILERLKRDLIPASGQPHLSARFLLYMFLDPEIACTLQVMSARTVDNESDAIEQNNRALSTETMIFIGAKDGEIVIAGDDIATDFELRPPLPERESPLPPSDTTDMVFLHTHPFRYGGVLGPSVIEEDELGIRGDLTAFPVMREIGSFIDRPLMVILQDDLKRRNVDILFIREKEGTAQLDRETYLQKLRENKNALYSATTQTKLQRDLSSSGFYSAYLNIPISEFYNYPPYLDPHGIQAVAQQLGIPLV